MGREGRDAPEVERAVLAAVLVDPRQLDDVLQQLRSDASDFLDERHRRIVRAICALDASGQGASIDLVTVGDWLEQAGELAAIGGSAFLAEISAGVAVGSNAEAYARAVREHSIRRKLRGFAAKITDSTSKQSAADVLETAERELFAIAEGAHDAPPLAIVGDIAELADTADETRSHTGISTGFPDLDERMGKLRKSDLVLVGARPGEGKTSLGLNIALAAGLDGRRVLVFSLEMPRRQIAIRLLYSEAEVDARQLQRSGRTNDADVSRVVDAARRLKDLRIFVDDSNVTPVELRSKARQLTREQGGLDLIVVDYLQLMSGVESGRGRFESRTLEIASISRTLKLLARELQAPILALSQLNRDKDKAGEFAPPRLSHLRESGALEQDADVVLLLHRPRERKERDAPPGAPQTRQVIVAKNRHGPTGVVDLAWRGKYTRFETIGSGPAGDRVFDYETDW